MGFPVKEFCMSYVLTRAQLVVGMGFPVYGIMDVLCTYKTQLVVGMGFPVKEFCMSYVLTRAQLVVEWDFLCIALCMFYVLTRAQLVVGM
jgi:hypothetical protein